MGLELAQLYLSVQADTASVQPSLASLQSSVGSQMQGIAQQTANAVGGAMQSAEEAAARSAANIRRILGGVLGFVSTYAGMSTLKRGLFAAGAIEQDKIAFGTLIGNAKETEETLKKLVDFAAETPFEMPEIRTAARGLITFGERGDEMMDTLRIIGNAAAGTSSDFGMLALIFNQVRGVGKLLTQDFRQLSSRGVISLQEIADYYGVTTAKAQEMLSKGKISFEDLRKILAKFSDEGGKFYNLMEKQSGSFMGVISTLKDTINITFAAIGEGIRPIATKILAATLPILDFVRQLATDLGPLTGNVVAMTTAVTSLYTAIMGVVVAAKLLGLTLRQVLIGTGIGILLVGVGVALGLIITGVQKLYDSLKTMVPFQGAIASAAWRINEAWMAVKETFFALAATIASAIENIFGVKFGEIPSTVEGVVIQCIDMFADFVVNIASYTVAIVRDWRLSWEIIKTSTAIVLVTIADKVYMVWNTVKASAMAAAVGIFTYWKTMAIDLINIFSALASTISAVFKSLWEAVKSGFRGEGLGGMVESFKRQFVEQMSKIDLEIKNPLSEGADAFIKTFTESMGPDSPLAGTLDTLKKDLSDMTQRLTDSAADVKSSIIAGRMAKTEEEEKSRKKAKEAEAEAVAASSLGFGRYGITDYGRKMQEVLLKSKDDKQAKMVSLLETGNKKQDELIAAVKETGERPLVLT